MTSEEFIKAISTAEKINIDILRYMSNSVDLDYNDMDKFVDDFIYIVKKYNDEEKSILFIHLYFLLFNFGAEEIEKYGIIDTFSLLKTMYKYDDNNKEVH